MARMGDRRGTCRVFIARPEVKRLLGRPRRRWENNIKMDLKDVEWRGMDWIDLEQDREWWQDVVNVVMNFRVPKNAEN